MTQIKDSLWQTKEKERKADVRFIVTLCLLIIFIFSVLFLNNRVYVTVKVDGASMENTLFGGDVLTVNRLKEADYGDIIVINAKSGSQEKWIIKRLIGKAGDTIEVKDGHVYRNGQELKESYVKNQTSPSGSKTTWVVPEGEIFFLGDNRAVSLDSRSDIFGTQKESDVIGVVENWSIALKEIRGVIYVVLEKVGGLIGFNSCLNEGS